MIIYLLFVFQCNREKNNIISVIGLQSATFSGNLKTSRLTSPTKRRLTQLRCDYHHPGDLCGRRCIYFHIINTCLDQQHFPRCVINVIHSASCISLINIIINTMANIIMIIITDIAIAIAIVINVFRASVLHFNFGRKVRQLRGLSGAAWPCLAHGRDIIKNVSCRTENGKTSHSRATTIQVQSTASKWQTSCTEKGEQREKVKKILKKM